jgi:hypothetical protein
MSELKTRSTPSVQFLGWPRGVGGIPEILTDGLSPLLFELGDAGALEVHGAADRLGQDEA